MSWLALAHARTRAWPSVCVLTPMADRTGTKEGAWDGDTAALANGIAHHRPALSHQQRPVSHRAGATGRRWRRDDTVMSAQAEGRGRGGTAPVARGPSQKAHLLLYVHVRVGRAPVPTPIGL